VIVGGLSEVCVGVGACVLGAEFWDVCTVVMGVLV
jgi:hypothetical protein